jgi:hypothetical protein
MKLDIDDLLDIPGRSATQNSSYPAKSDTLPARRLIGSAPLWLLTAAFLGMLATAAVLAGARDLPGTANATLPRIQASTVVPVAAAVSGEVPVVLRGQSPLRANRL